MQGLSIIPSSIFVPSHIPSHDCNSDPRNYFPRNCENPLRILQKNHSFSPLSIFSPSKHLSHHKCNRTQKSFSLKASSSVGSAEYVEEPATNVRFQTSLNLPGCSSSLPLLGTGYREKVFAIIGVKVYAAGLYINESILCGLNSWKGLSASEIQKDSSLFKSIFQAI